MARRERLEKAYEGLLPIVQTLSKSDWETLRSFFDEMFRKKAAEVRLDSEKDSKIIENCFKLHVLNEPLSSIIPPLSEQKVDVEKVVQSLHKAFSSTLKVNS